MCGRYSLARQTTEREYDEYFRRIMEAGLELKPRYNIAPSQKAPVIRLMDGKAALEELRWGFRPGWLEDKAKAQINARAETLFTSKMFRSAAMKQRCLVLASGWYEWQKVAGGKQPQAFHMKDDSVFAFAGIWTRWTDDAGTPDDSYAIITTQASKDFEHIHNRMPVVLTGNSGQAWLQDDTADVATAEKLLQPYTGNNLEVYPVSTYVNSPRNIGPQCIEPFNA